MPSRICICLHKRNHLGLSAALFGSWFCPWRYCNLYMANQIWDVQSLKTHCDHKEPQEEPSHNPNSRGHLLSQESLSQYRAVSAHAHSPCWQHYPDLKERIISSFLSLVKYFLLLSIFTIPNLTTPLCTNRHAETVHLHVRWQRKKSSLLCH